MILGVEELRYSLGFDPDARAQVVYRQRLRSCRCNVQIVVGAQVEKAEKRQRSGSGRTRAR